MFIRSNFDFSPSQRWREASIHYCNQCLSVRSTRSSAVMSTDDSLVVIPPEEWPELRDLYQANWPANLVAYHTVDNFIQWHRKDPHIRNLTFYSLNGTWRQDGTYVIVVSE